MDNKKLLAVLLAAMMSVSTTSAAFAATEDEITKGYPDGDVWESKLYAVMLEEGDKNEDGKLTEGEAAAITTLTVDGLSLGALKGLDKCTGLKSLVVTDSKVQDLSFLSKLSGLEELTLSGNNIQDLSALSGLNNLKTLDLSDNAVLTDLTALKSLSALESLDVSGTAVADVSKLPSNLSVLDVSRSKVRDLNGLPATLTSLKASGNSIEDVSMIDKLTALEILDLSDNLIRSIPDLNGLSALSKLDLKGNSLKKEEVESKLPSKIKTPGWENEVLGTGSAEPVDKTELRAAIANAQSLLDATVPSPDGKDVAKTEMWATAENIKTFTDAVKAAQAVADRSDASEEEVEAAVSALKSAQSDFESQRKMGEAEFSRTPLVQAIESAEALLASVEQADNAEAVESGKQWVTPSVYTSFTDAIQKAKGVLAAADEESDITTAVSELNNARDTFRGEIRFGTKPITPDPEPTPSTSREYTDYYGNEKWDEVKDEIAELIEDGKEGETIEFNAAGLPYFPASVARALKGEDITLKIRKNGVTYVINGLEIGAIDKIWYDFEDIESELLTVDNSKDENASSEDNKKNPDTGR